MKVTIFGAAFDPPHLGHQKIALSLLEQGLAESVWLLPVKDHAFGKKLAPVSDRLVMVELLAEEVRKLLKIRGIGRHAGLVGENIVTLNSFHGPVGNVSSEKNVLDNSQDKIRVEKFELDQKGTSYTYKTLQQLSTLYPEHLFSFVIGSDNLARFHEWQNYEQMLEKFPFFLYPRKDFPMSPIKKGMIALENVEPIDVSSTQVRELAAKGQGIDHLVPAEISKYLQEHKLYLDHAS